MHRFALIGAAGYIAPRHMQAIRATGNEIVALLDPHDSVGLIDSYFPGADYFREPERFDRHLDKLRRGEGTRVDYVAIASPNYLHDAHIRLALRNGSNAICEKPLVLNPWNVDALQQIEAETGQQINVILQLRLHPTIRKLSGEMMQGGKDRKQDVDLTYITSRGRWYHHSWKGDVQKSGGVATNIGIHFFDMLLLLFGDVQLLEVHHQDEETVAGFLELERARVRWFLSVSERYIPSAKVAEGQRTYRSILLGNQELEFSGGFTDLHTLSYQEILNDRGFTPADARRSIELVYNIRNASPSRGHCEYHPFLKLIQQ